jgi:hypothetical protein
MFNRYERVITEVDSTFKKLFIMYRGRIYSGEGVLSMETRDSTMSDRVKLIC